MAASGQTLNDRINAARYALAGQGLARCVCKATTEEIIGPKKKHLDYLLACTHEPNVSIPQLANLLIERTNHVYWVVVFKALVTVHHLMSYGNERLTQYLASSNYSFELSTYLDKTTALDFSMSTFIRRYSRYINEKALSYRLLAFDLCKVKRGSEGVLRVMPIDRLLKTLPILQNQLDALLGFDCTANDLNNGVINACFMLLFRDLIGLFACHNDGIINLLNKYFNLNKKTCREAFDHYKKFLVRMDKVSEFLRVAEAVGIDKDEIPDLRRAPSSLIDALEQHLENLESNKKILKQQSNSTVSSNNTKSLGEFSILGGLTPPRSSPGFSTPEQMATTSNTAATDEFSSATFRDDEVRKALEEEARVLSQYGSDGSKTSKSDNPSKGKASSSSTGDNSPKFAVTTVPKTLDSIFGDSDAFASVNNGVSVAKEALPSSESKTANIFESLPSSSNPTFSATKHMPDFDSIKSTIQSATTTLEKSNAQGAKTSEISKSVSAKKASDELFSLLDTPTASTNPLPATSSSSLIMDPMSQLTSVFTSPSPFDLPANGQSSVPMKPGNPFPDVGSDLTSSPVFPLAFAANAPLPAPTQVTTTSNLAFKPSNPIQSSAPNYTNLGRLDNFGDLLQPMSSINNKTNSSTNNNNNYTAMGQSKSSFNPGTNLTSTGLFKGDLDSTLANLAQNLTFEGINKTKK